MKDHGLKPMQTIDIRFNTRAALALVRKDLRKMRATDPVMYWSLIGAMVFLVLDLATILTIFAIIYQTS
jgi:hypothetical protein